MKKLLFLFLLVCSFGAFSQSVTITHNGITPNQGGVQKLTYDQIRQLPNPQEGDLAYDLTFNCLRHYNGTEWLCVTQENSLIPNAAIVKLLTSSSVEPTGLELDSQENIIIMGVFNGTINFGTTSLTSINSDMFLAKYDKHGNEIWALQEGENSDSQVFPSQIAIDNADNIYVSGSFWGRAQFGINVYVAAVVDMFLVKYNSSGVTQFTKRYVSGDGVKITGLSVDIAQNIYSCGSFNSTITLGTSTFTNSDTEEDAFVIRHNSDGNLAWSNQVIYTNEKANVLLTSDLIGNLYFCVNHIREVSFLSTSYFSSGGADFKLFKLNNAGALVWVESINGSGNQTVQRIQSYGSKVGVVGTFGSSFTFLNQSISSLSSTLTDHSFILQFNGTNRSLLWQTIIHSSSFQGDYALDHDALGNAYIGLVYSSNIEAEPFFFQSINSSTDISFLKFSGSSGEILEAKSIGGIGIDALRGIQIRTANGKVFLASKHYDSSLFIGTEKIPKDASAIIVLD
ncbi:hypothetical protein SAMN06298216_1511 [Spirosomataceae bacterium TFI 002]|nr:hypothetical protein SAMN06298216_1511 [Spirosomataceae bacterium TFI 002]